MEQTEQQKVKVFNRIYLTDKALTQQHLTNFSKEQLINLIVDNKHKLVQPKDRGHHNSKGQRPFDFAK